MVIFSGRTDYGKNGLRSAHFNAITGGEPAQS